MSDYTEKRIDKRIDHKADLTLQKPGLSDQTSDARMVNYSRHGMCFRTGEKLKIGQEIYIKILDYDEESDGPEQEESYTGYVRWSDNLGTSQPGGQYGYGVQYHVPPAG